MNAKQNKTYISCWSRSDFPSLWETVRLWDWPRLTKTDQDGPKEIHWNFASRNTMMLRRLTDLGRIWPLLSLLELLGQENIQYQTFVTKKYFQHPISNPKRKHEVVKYQIQFFYLEKEIQGGMFMMLIKYMHIVRKSR